MSLGYSVKGSKENGRQEMNGNGNGNGNGNAYKGKEKEKGRYQPARRRGDGGASKWGNVAAYGVFSALMACALKYAVSGIYWNLNFFLLGLQSACALGGIYLLRRRGYLQEIAALDRQKIRRWIPLSILLLVSNYISYKALQYLSLPTYILLSTTTIFTVPYMDNILFGSAVPSFALPSYLLIFSGICISVITENAHAEQSYGDRRLEQTLEPQDPVVNLFFGYLLMLLHLVLHSVYEAWKKKVVVEVKFGEWDVFIHNHLLNLILASTLSYLIEDFSSENMNDCFPTSTRNKTILTIIYTCIGLFPILFFSQKIERQTSQGATVHKIVKASTKMGIALLGMYTFSHPISVASISSIVVGCSGNILGAWMESRAMERERGVRILPV